MLATVNVRFPNLGINFNNMKSSFKMLGAEISVQFMITAIAVLVGMAFVIYEAKRTWQDVDTYINLCVCAIITGIIGARLYYVIMMWTHYKNNLSGILNIWHGGFSASGGIIAVVITCIIFSGIKKVSLLKIADTICPGVVLGQAVAVWGNLFSREVLGKYTDSLFAMQIKYDEVNGVINQKILDHIVRYGGELYVQVHPVFLYESLWCIALFIILLLCSRFRKFEGEMFLWCIAGYSIGRVWIEFFKSGSMKIPGTGIHVAMLLAVLAAVASISVCIVKHIIAVRTDKEYT